MMAMAGDEGITNDDAALVFRRAAELDAQARPGAAPALTPAAIEQIAAEAGLSTASVRRAIAELRAGTLTAPPAAGRGALGPALVVVERMVAMPAADATAAVDHYLRRQLFAVQRHFGERKLWEPRTGVGPALSRSLDFNRRLVLTSVSLMTATVAAEPGSRSSCIRFEAALTGVRRGFRILTAGGMVLGAGTIAGAVVLTGDVTALASIPAGAAVAGGTYAAARSGYRSAAARIETALERFLDTLEHGLP